MDVLLEDENGIVQETVHDPKMLLSRLLRQYDPEESILGQIDPYGDTVFNSIQMPLLMRAWHGLMKRAEDAEVMALLESVKRMAESCESGVHLYLRFSGD